MTSSNAVYYGYASGLITAATLQPLDNIKMTLMIPPNRLTLSSNFAKNIYLATKYIQVEEGLRYFYRGLIANIWKTGVGSAVYFTSLRLMQRTYDRCNSVGHFFSSGLSRIISSAVTNPFAVAQTRYQVPGSEQWRGRMILNMQMMYKQQGLKSFFKGCNASCLKEAGFAALYYALYMKGKQHGFDSISAGMCAGLISTLSTHPLQIIRTRSQAPIETKLKLKSAKKESIIEELFNMMRQGRLFDGVLPRLIKKPAANTLGFVLFQYFQNMKLSSQN